MRWKSTAPHALKATFLAKMISGEWTGTMNLTEPHAGSDLGVLKTRAERRDDGTYRIFGQKIFITWGEHDVDRQHRPSGAGADLPDAPEGTRGISLFLVPKFLVNDGWLARRPQRSVLPFARTQARHPCLADLHHGLWRRQVRR